MVVEVGIGCSDEVSGDSIPEKNAEDTILNGVRLVLIKSDENHGVLHEVLIFQERSQERFEPDTCNGNGRVVSIRGHVGGDEHPLGQLVVFQVLVEQGCVLDLSNPVGTVGN